MNIVCVYFFYCTIKTCIALCKESLVFFLTTVVLLLITGSMIYCVCPKSPSDMMPKRDHGRDVELDKKIEALRRKNEVLMKRYKVGPMPAGGTTEGQTWM